MSKKKFSILIFDLDGTLIDSRADLTTAVNLMRKQYGLPALSIETVTSYVGNGTRKLVERALSEMINANVDEGLELLKKFYNIHMLDATYLYPGVANGLKELHKNGYTLVLLTNKPTEPAKQILKHFQLDSLFTLIAGGDSEYPLKPEPDALTAIIANYKGNPKQSWIIGDNYTDLECGRKAGIKRCYAAYGFGNPENEQWDKKISKFSELLKVVNS